MVSNCACSGPNPGTDCPHSNVFTLVLFFLTFKRDHRLSLRFGSICALLPPVFKPQDFNPGRICHPRSLCALNLRISHKTIGRCVFRIATARNPRRALLLAHKSPSSCLPFRHFHSTPDPSVLVICDHPPTSRSASIVIDPMFASHLLFSLFCFQSASYPSLAVISHPQQRRAVYLRYFDSALRIDGGAEVLVVIVVGRICP